MAQNDYTAGYEQFVTLLDETFEDGSNFKDFLFDTTEDDKVRVSNKNQAGKIYNAVVRFLNSAQLHGNRAWDSRFAINGTESRFEPGRQSYSQLAGQLENLKNLLKECEIPASQQKRVAAELTTCLTRYTDPETAISKHWASRGAGSEAMSGHTFYGSERHITSSFGFFFNPMAPGAEAFGAQMDLVLPDIRAAMTVILLKPHRGITDRIYHKKPVTNPVVRYVIPFDEIFDLNKASSEDNQERDGWDHRVPMLSLYRNPAQMQFMPIEVFPKKSNDLDDLYLEDDGLIKFNIKANLFNLARDPANIKTRADHTSFISEGTFIKRVKVKVTQYGWDAGTNAPDKSNVLGEEEYFISLGANPRTRLVMKEQPMDSGDRETQFTEAVQFKKGKKDALDADTVIFDTVDDPYIAYMHMQMSANLNRKSSNVAAQMFGWFEVKSITDTGADIPDELKQLAKCLEVTGICYELDVRYSEENARLSSLIVRNNIFGFTHELPATRNFLFDYSMAQTQPEQVLDTINTVQQLGCDDRNLKLMEQLFELVAVEYNRELSDPNYRYNSDNQTLNMRYAASSRVNPIIIIRNIELADVVSIRSSDWFGDIRQYMDSYLTKIFSELHVNSLYVQQLDYGEKPNYKVITSIPILENVLSIPHIHNHLMPNGMAGEQLYGENKAQSTKDYVRVLPSGVTLNCLPVTFDYFRDKIMIIPFRENKSESEYNFATNYEFGTFAAHYTPQMFGGVNKRLLVNVREYPIPTNPIGIQIVIKDLNKHLPDITKVTP